jgi:glucose dehydrogenase
MQHVEILSAALGLLGAALLASRSRWAGWAFVAWLISNIGWIVFGAGHQHWFFIAQQIGFTITSVLGIWNWLIHPALRQSEAEDESARERRAQDVIDYHLDRDFVGLAQGTHVLHTTAPVSYMALQRIYMTGEEEGRALERERSGVRL